MLPKGVQNSNVKKTSLKEISGINTSNIFVKPQLPKIDHQFRVFKKFVLRTRFFTPRKPTQTNR